MTHRHWKLYTQYFKEKYMNTDGMTDHQLIRLYEDYVRAKRLTVKTYKRQRAQVAALRGELRKRALQQEVRNG